MTTNWAEKDWASLQAMGFQPKDIVGCLIDKYAQAEEYWAAK